MSRCFQSQACDWIVWGHGPRGGANEWKCTTCDAITARRPMSREEKARNAERQREFQARRKARAEAGASADADRAEDTVAALEKQIAELRKSRDSWRKLAKANQAMADNWKAQASSARTGDSLAEVIRQFGKKKLVAFIHPDKHGGHPVANAICQLVNARY